MTIVPSLSDQRAREFQAQTVAEQIIFERQIRPRVTPEIVEEHKNNPIGHHSDDLERVLIYLRKHHGQMAGKYILVCTIPHQEWRVAMNTGRRNEPPQLLEETYTDRYEAEHGIFLMRLKDAKLI